MRVRADIEYPAGPVEVFAMITDPAFQDRKLSRTGASTWKVQIDPAGGGVVVRSERSLPTDRVPEAFRAFVGTSVTLVQTETWGPAAADGARTGRLVVEIGGAPVRLDASLTLTATATGSTETVDGELKAKVPLIGGRIERGAEPAVRAAIDAEQRIGQEWLAAR